MTEEEQALMSQHAAYLASLVARKIVFLAGPHLEPTYGMVLLRAESKERALEIMSEDPTVQAGLMSVEISPFLAPEQMRDHYIPENRYVKEPTDRALRKEALVKATPAEVFAAWTTNEGVKTFFAPDANVELRVGGPYEIYFNPDPESEFRGSEDCHVLAFSPDRMFAFEWNAPPTFGDLRYIYTQVVFLIEKTADGSRVELTHSGWGESAEWGKVYEYFDEAWDVVLARLVQRFERGAFDWDAIP
jgi:uncharacterized protein YndB with AHSA1/START domain/uncharacterized protein YciI